MVSARGDIRAASSGKVRNGIATCRSGTTSGFSIFFFGGAPRFNGGNPCSFGSSSLCKFRLGEVPKFKGAKPNAPGELEPNRWAPNPGDGGGLGSVMTGANPGDIGGRPSEGGTSPGDGGGLDNEARDANPESGCRDDGLEIELRLNLPNFPGSFSSSFSVHEKLEGADDGPGEMGSPLFGVEFPLARIGLLSGVGFLVLKSSLGSGAVNGSLGEMSIWSAESVILCFVGLLPGLVLSPDVGILLLDTSF